MGGEEADPDGDGPVAVCDGDAERTTDSEVLGLRLTEFVGEDETVGVLLPGTESLRDDVCVSEVDDEGSADTVPRDVEGVGESVTAGEADSVGVAFVNDCEGDAERHSDSDVLALRLTLSDGVDDSVGVPLPAGDALSESLRESEKTVNEASVDIEPWLVEAVGEGVTGGDSEADGDPSVMLTVGVLESDGDDD